VGSGGDTQTQQTSSITHTTRMEWRRPQRRTEDGRWRTDANAAERTAIVRVVRTYANIVSVNSATAGCELLSYGTGATRSDSANVRARAHCSRNDIGRTVCYAASDGLTHRTRGLRQRWDEHRTTSQRDSTRVRAGQTVLSRRPPGLIRGVRTPPPVMLHTIGVNCQKRG